MQHHPRQLTDLIKFRGRPKQHYVQWSKRLNNAPFPVLGRARPTTANRAGPAQRVIVKVHYFTPDRFPHHARYLEHEGKGENGAKPQLFTRQGEAPPLGSIAGEPRYFTVKLSPEHGERLDMQRYTQEFMRRVETMRPAITDDGNPAPPLRWLAAVHYNTEHPHAHILIRGIDAAGNEVILPPAFISHNMRAIACQIATRVLGPRTEQEILQQREREITAERFTTLDRQIANQLDPGTNDIQTSDRDITRRLDYLIDAGEAQELSPGHYHLAERWDRHLRQKGERGDILKSIFADMGTKAPQEDHILIYRSSWTVDGAVTYKGLNEETEQPYAIVQQGRSSYYYTSPKAQELSLGDHVRLDHGTATILRQQHPGPEQPASHDQGLERSISRTPHIRPQEDTTP